MKSMIKVRIFQNKVVLIFATFLIFNINGLSLNNMGQTYNYYDSMVTRVTAQFESFTAIIDRNQADIYGTIYQSIGTETIYLHYFASEEKIRIDYLNSGQTLQIMADTQPFYSTSWVLQQIYTLEKFREREEEGPLLNLTWRNSFLVPEGATELSDIFEDDELIAITTEFLDSTAYSAVQDPTLARGIVVATFDTQIYDNSTGQLIGQTKWFNQYQTFAWKFPGSSGFASNETIPGGLLFTPNKIWANIQAFAFSRFHGGQLMNTVGCDGLHWLDGTIFRSCCDEHDRCYLNDPNNPNDDCTAGSWFFFGNEGRRWYCFRCNVEVVLCFLSGGGGNSGNTGGIGGNPGVCFGEPGTTAWFVGCDPFAM